MKNNSLQSLRPQKFKQIGQPAKKPGGFLHKLTAITGILLFFLSVLLPVSSCAAENKPFVPTDPVLPLSQVKPGMKAEIRTVLQGTKISRFSATLLGIVPRKTSPKNLILIRVDDPYVRANGGIAAGMSGSPVYVGGKLVGAIGYGWQFSDNNLGLVTPIGEMVKAFNWPDKILVWSICKDPERAHQCGYQT